MKTIIFGKEYIVIKKGKFYYYLQPKTATFIKVKKSEVIFS